MLMHGELSGTIIDAAIEVHRNLGPGLLESAYEHALCHELGLQKISFQRQVRLPVHYKGVSLDCGYQIDLLVDERAHFKFPSLNLLPEGLLGAALMQTLLNLRCLGLLEAGVVGHGCHNAEVLNELL